ncbi:MAG: response regulator [Deltaproteobacteria bacterium]|jgi:DNA-binding NtrC family response regulator|nr:response regulator [Deltaproteobacteria bacterium]MBW2467797.1 response regulator [Deltaproteobacteria bacterium]MBW2488465.1 response regulator [Deltaproteobacteria bacterium]MBW2515772.1 response regulator [Deltaproteobacteria bacterium]
MAIRILIIEAENRFRKNLYQCLQKKGFTVDKLTPKDDVAAVVAKEKIDVVLLGVDGLGMEGLTLIQPLKTISPGTEIIIINDSNHMDLSIEAMDLGAFDDFLIPLDIDSLASRIREAVSRKNQSE